MKAKNKYFSPIKREEITEEIKGRKESPSPHLALGKVVAMGDARQARDFYCPGGTPVFAAQKGKVAFILPQDNMFGQDCRVILEHPKGEYTTYSPFKRGTIPLKVGDMVKKGDLIGNVDNPKRDAINSHLRFFAFKLSSPQPWKDYETLEVDFEK